MLNEIILQGRLTTDPELKTTNSGKSVTSFSLAVERDFSTDGEKITDFINIVVWGKTAEFVCNHFRKGRQMLVRGSLQTRKYQTQNGENRTATEVVADKVWFAGDKGEQNSKNADVAVGGFSQNVDDLGGYVDEELPF